MKSLTAHKEYPANLGLDTIRVLDAIAGEAGVINRTINPALREPLAEMSCAAQTWIDVSFPQKRSPIYVGHSGSHVWVHLTATNKRVLLITEQDASVTQYTAASLAAYPNCGFPD